MPRFELSPLDRQLCAETTIGFFVNLDRGRFDRILDLLTDDVKWVRRGQPLTGHAEVLAALRDRDATMVSRHIVTNIEAEATRADEAEVYFTVMAFQHVGHNSGPAQVTGPDVLLTSRDRLVRVGAQWKIAHKESHVTFLIGAK